MKLDDKSRDILGFKPNINFVEPDQEPSSPHPVKPPPDATPIDDKKEETRKLAKYARSVSALAGIVQGLIDNDAAGVCIKLDPSVDATAIQAMRRTYGISDHICYEHYKQCEDNLRKYAENTANKMIITEDEVSDAREAILKGKVTIGGIGTEEASNGGLRPELDKRNQVIEPVDLDELQDGLYAILMNTLWQKFIKPVLDVIPMVTLPDKIAPTSEQMDNQVKDTKEKTATPETPKAPAIPGLE